MLMLITLYAAIFATLLMLDCAAAAAAAYAFDMLLMPYAFRLRHVDA